jgi:hypothetical protein
VLHFSQDSGSPQIGDVMVPALDPYDTFTASFSNIVFNTPGTYSICATADGGFSISEANENNNTGCMIVTVLPNKPDLYPASGLAASLVPRHGLKIFGNESGWGCQRRFDCKILVKKDEVVGTYYLTIAGIEAGAVYGFTKSIDYPSPEIILLNCNAITTTNLKKPMKATTSVTSAM